MNTWTKSCEKFELQREDFDAVRIFYFGIRTRLICATNFPEILPPFEHLTKLNCDLKAYTQITFCNQHLSAKNNEQQLQLLSQSLLYFLQSPGKIQDSCTNINKICMIHASEHCGLSLLSKILQEIYPHLGGKFIDIIEEISTLQIDQGDTLASFLERTLTLKRRIAQSKHAVPGTAIFSRFLKQLMKTSKLNTVLASVHVDLTNHIFYNGPDIPFTKTEYEIYKLLISSGFSRDLKLFYSATSTRPSQYQTNLTNFEKAHNDNKDLDLDPQAAAGLQHTCEICGQGHFENRCWNRGEAWKPVWLKQQAKKYNAAHQDDKPDEVYINAPRPPRRANIKNYKDQNKKKQHQTNKCAIPTDNATTEVETEFTPSTSTGIFITSAGDVSPDDDLDSVARILKETHPQASAAKIVEFKQPSASINTSGVIKVSAEEIASLYNISDSSFTEL